MISVGNIVTDPEEFTVLVWVKVAASFTSNVFIARKSSNLQIIISTSNFYRCFVRYTGDDNDSWTANDVLVREKWQCVVYQFYGSAVAPRIFVGDEQTPITETPSYGNQTPSTGTREADAGVAYTIGGNGGSSGLGGAIAAKEFVLSSNINLKQMRDWQYNPRPGMFPNSLFHIRPGEHGLTFQQDLSGSGNHGLATGTLEFADNPFPMRPKPAKLYAVPIRKRFAIIDDAVRLGVR